MMGEYAKLGHRHANLDAHLQDGLRLNSLAPGRGGDAVFGEIGAKRHVGRHMVSVLQAGCSEAEAIRCDLLLASPEQTSLLP
ncbi:MAG: hypothetical protein VR78_04390 [Hoeflea sp. BRH_c9]|nr:MAG: hypothetical protein VR78_10300 [Hoeflea sp. BRH_c9]KJS18619.1 MAG: hypothetical protein VR78_04390 [Hoeflea sp. BRH_c9]